MNDNCKILIVGKRYMYFATLSFAVIPVWLAGGMRPPARRSAIFFLFTMIFFADGSNRGLMIFHNFF